MEFLVYPPLKQNCLGCRASNASRFEKRFTLFSFLIEVIELCLYVVEKMLRINHFYHQLTLLSYENFVVA